MSAQPSTQSGRRAAVFQKGRLAGVLSEEPRGYRFVYDPDYGAEAPPVSLAMPVRSAAYEAPQLFPVFEGLLPEGWYREVCEEALKISVQDDPFGALLALCAGANVGSVQVRRLD